MIVGGVNSDGTDMRVETFGGRQADAMAVAEAAGRNLAREVMLR